MTKTSQNGAHLLVETLLAGGVDVCFANPGTSEMHFVAALDQLPGIRCVLKLFEGGVTGAADGYYRMAQRPAATLLHLGPGFANGWANLHNARKATAGVVNIVGDHATYHAHHDAPLTSDIDGVIGSISDWVKRSPSAEQIAQDGTTAIKHAYRGQIATLILPADTAWQTATDTAIPTFKLPTPSLPSAAQIGTIAAQLAQPGTALMLGNRALHEDTLALAGQIAHATGCALFIDFFNGRWARGGDRVRPTHLTYSTAINQTLMQDVDRLVLLGAKPPVAFFAYPDQPSVPTRPDCAIIPFVSPQDDVVGTLQALVAELDAHEPLPVLIQPPPTLPTGALTKQSLCQAIAALLPENAIVVDEAIALWQHLHPATAHAAPHDWLAITGGAIGHALPCAVGAAVACPDRKVLALEGDGSAMYTIQSLWSMAREKLDIVVVIVSNRGYQVLFNELKKMGIDPPGKTATSLLEMTDPEIDWGSIAAGFGVAFGRATTLDAVVQYLQKGFSEAGPLLIEVVI